MWKILVPENSFLVLNDFVSKYYVDILNNQYRYVWEGTKEGAFHRTMLSQKRLESKFRCESGKTEPECHYLIEESSKKWS